MCILAHIPDSKVHGANMGAISGRWHPGGPHVGPMNFAMWDAVWAHETFHKIPINRDDCKPL